MKDSRVKAEDLFGELRREEKEEVRNIEVNNDIKKLFDRFEELYIGCMKQMSTTHIYSFFHKNLGHFPSKDITAFSANLQDILNKKDKDRVGLFISALIYKCEEKEILIYSNKELPVNYIGFRNDGHDVIIKGNALGVGYNMKSGKIIVNGNCEVAGTRMSGGMIRIEGDVLFSVGNGMAGGEIYVKGHIGKTYGKEEDYGGIVGADLKGGKIYVEGDIPRLPRYAEGGDIYHKGVQVIKNGARV